VAVAEDVVAELLVLLRRPQALAVLHLGLLARLAPHYYLLVASQRRNNVAAEDAGAESSEQEEGGRKEH